RGRSNLKPLYVDSFDATLALWRRTLASLLRGSLVATSPNRMLQPRPQYWPLISASIVDLQRIQLPLDLIRVRSRINPARDHLKHILNSLLLIGGLLCDQAFQYIKMAPSQAKILGIQKMRLGM